MTNDQIAATASDVADALRRLVRNFRLGPEDEGRDELETLQACIEDLDGITDAISANP